MDVQTLTVVVTGIGVLIAAINQIYTSRQANQQRAIELKTQELTLHAQQQALETRQTQLFMQIYDRWNSPELTEAYGTLRYLIRPQIDDYDDWMQKFDPLTQATLDPWKHAHLLNTYLEGLGVLVKRGLINVDMVDDLFANRIKWYWEEFLGPYADVSRKRYDDPHRYDDIEFLYNKLNTRTRPVSTS